ncbi:MAG: PepSY-associated TM helix domain-containing protein, partial [Angustibacter sp.]
LPRKSPAEIPNETHIAPEVNDKYPGGRRSSPTPPRGLFRAFWRWHFYASVLVIPILLMLSITGLIYLFRFQVEPLLHADLMRVTRPAGAELVDLELQRRAVAETYPEYAIGSVTEPRTDRDPTRFTLSQGELSRDVFVNPWRGRVLGMLNPDTTLSGYAIRLHGDLLTGRWGDAVIELASCWALVMTATGLYLAIRGRSARARRLRAARSPRARRIIRLRHRHAMVGICASGGLLLLIISGLPWTGLWGENVQKLATGRGTSLWSTDPGAASDPRSTMDESMPHSHDVPWAQGGNSIPRSTGKAAASATVDTAALVGERAGLRHPLTILLPSDEQGVYSVLGDAFHDPGREKTV